MLKTCHKIKNCTCEGCPKEWDNLPKTSNYNVRHCGICNEDVFCLFAYDDTVEQTKPKHCTPLPKKYFQILDDSFLINRRL
jgi:hypothetical protein